MLALTAQLGTSNGPIGSPAGALVRHRTAPTFSDIKGVVCLGSGRGEGLSNDLSNGGGVNCPMAGVNAHAAVRMHVTRVAKFATSWIFRPEIQFGTTPKYSHFQRWKVAL